MKKEDFIKLGLDEETAKKCEAASTAELEAFVPKAQFDELIGEKNNLETMKTTLEGQLDGLKNSTGDIDALKGQIETLQADNKAKDDAHALEVKTLKIGNAIDTAISGMKGKNAKAIKALLDMEKVSLDDKGNVVGHTDQLKALIKAEDSKFLFDAESQPQFKGAKVGESGDYSGGSVDPSKMSYTEFEAFVDANPNTQI